MQINCLGANVQRRQDTSELQLQCSIRRNGWSGIRPLPSAPPLGHSTRLYIPAAQVPQLALSSGPENVFKSCPRGRINEFINTVAFEELFS